MQIKLFLCADSASIDSRQNTISAFHILEQINAPGFPVVVPRIAVVMLASREQNDPSVVELHLQILLGVQQLFDGPVPINFNQQLLTRAIIDLQGLLLPGPGELRLLLKEADDVLESWAVVVNQVGGTPVQMIFPPPAAAPSHS